MGKGKGLEGGGMVMTMSERLPIQRCQRGGKNLIDSS